MRVASEMSEDVRSIALEGIRSRHPKYDDARARRALFRLLLGEDLVRAMWRRRWRCSGRSWRGSRAAGDRVARRGGCGTLPAMTVTARDHATSRMTFEEAALLDPDQQPGELVDGEWVPVTRSTWRHGEVVTTVAFLLKLYAREHAGWSVSAADPGVRLSRDPDRLRGPDVGMVRVERVPKGKGVAGWLDGAPDVAVEVVGDSQTISEMTKKALEYLAAGAKMVWIIDVEPQRVVLFTPPDHVRILGLDDVLEGGATLPGFECKVAEFFG